MESRVAEGVAKVGLVREGTAIELEEAQWEVKDRADAPLRETGHKAVLKTLRLDKMLRNKRGQQSWPAATRPVGNLRTFVSELAPVHRPRG